MTKVAVLGAGAGGYTYAADLTLIGHRVSLCEMPFLKKEIEPVLRHGGIEIIPFGEEPTYFASFELEKRLPEFGPERSGFAEIHNVTTDIKEAVKGVDVILNAVPATYYQDWARHTAPHLEDGQTVITCGKGLGSFDWHNVAKEAGVKKRVVFGELNTLGYGSTRMGRIFGEEYENKIRIEGPCKTMTIGAFPGRDAEKAAETYASLYPEGTRNMKPAENALEVLLVDYNALTHTEFMICNAARIETGDKSYHLFGKDSATPAACRVGEGLDDERVALGTALELPEDSEARTPNKILGKWLIGDREPTYCNTLHNWFLEICEGPFSLKSRYLTEDVPMGLVAWSSLGEFLGVPTPVTDSVVTIAAVLNAEDYWKTGRTLEKAGINPSWSLEQLKKFMKEGSI